MRPWSRVAPDEYARLDLRAHALLTDVPLHDVWRVSLPGGGPDRSVEDLRSLMDPARVAENNPAVRVLFAIRGSLGRVFHWESDRETPAEPDPRSYLHRLSDADRDESRVPPGTPDGPFEVLYVRPNEALSEIRNATVHAFSLTALEPREGGYDFYWAIHVAPVGRITRFYMALIDPFRHWIVYPAILRHVHRGWCERFG